MKQYVLNTKSESGDDYTYFIISPEKPTLEEVEGFLEEHGNDIEEGVCWEMVDSIIEIPSEFQSLTGDKVLVK